MSSTVEQAVAAAFRESWGQIVATLIGATGDWDLAEESAQDAFTAALEAWSQRGIPDRPGAWLTSVARNRATDVLRRRALGAEAIRLARLLTGQTYFAACTGPMKPLSTIAKPSAWSAPTANDAFSSGGCASQRPSTDPAAPDGLRSPWWSGWMTRAGMRPITKISSSRSR
jgi:hypothetical protein